MNLGGLAVLFLVICGGLFGVFLVISHANMSAPVDSSGATTDLATNLTRTNATAVATPITYFGGGVALIVGVMILFAVVIYFSTGGRAHRSRYQ